MEVKAQLLQLGGGREGKLFFNRGVSQVQPLQQGMTTISAQWTRANSFMRGL